MQAEAFHGVGFGPVFFVADDRAAGVGQLHAELVAAAGFQSQLDQRPPLPPRQHPVVRDGVPGPLARRRAVAAAHRILKKGGRIAILDLLAHQFEKARELYADTWLGFTEAQLHSFLTDAGFTGIEITVVARDDKNPQFQTVLATGVKG